MITLHKLNGSIIVINPDLVEFLEETPDCLISMTTGRKLMVRETLDEVRGQLHAYRENREGPYPVPAGGEGYAPDDTTDTGGEAQGSAE